MTGTLQYHKLVRTYFITNGAQAHPSGLLALDPDCSDAHAIIIILTVQGSFQSSPLCLFGIIFTPRSTPSG